MLSVNEKKEIRALAKHKLKHLKLSYLAEISFKAWKYQHDSIMDQLASIESFDNPPTKYMGDLIEFAYGKEGYYYYDGFADGVG